MDYETADGSQFSLREISHDHDGESRFIYTSVTAFVQGKAYAGRTGKCIESLEDEEILGCLGPVPPECIHPPFPETFTRAPPFNSHRHYLKAPSFTYEDCQPGNTFVADCLLNEASVLEDLKNAPHPNLATYCGCVVKNGRITQLCLQKYDCALYDYVERQRQLTTDDGYKILGEIEAGIKHLHALGLAHNDISLENICIGYDGAAVIVDYDSCLPFGQKLLKGVAAGINAKQDEPVSNRENDLQGLDDIADILFYRIGGQMEGT